MDFKKWLINNKNNIIEKVLLSRRNPNNPFDMRINSGYGRRIEDYLNDKDFNIHKDVLDRLIDGKYLFSPYKAYYRRKKLNEFRSISIPNALDSVVFLIMKEYMNQVLIEQFGDFKENLYPKFRPFIKKAERLIKNGYIYAYKYDIEKFYDNISKDILLQKIDSIFPNDELLSKMIKRSLHTPTVYLRNGNNSRKKKNWESDFIENSKIKQNKGINTGICISNILANIYLFDFDKKMNKNYNDRYLRFYDDILILSKKSGELGKIKKTIEDEIKEIDLQLNEDKIHEYSLHDKGINYLNVTFFGDKLILNTEVLRNFRKQISNIYNDAYRSYGTQPKFFSDYIIRKWNSIVTNTSNFSYLSYFSLAEFDHNKRELQKTQNYFENRFKKYYEKHKNKIIQNINIQKLGHWVNEMHFRPDKAKKKASKYKFNNHMVNEINSIFQDQLPYPLEDAFEKIDNSVEILSVRPNMKDNLKECFEKYPYLRSQMTYRLKTLKGSNYLKFYGTISEILQDDDILYGLDKKSQNIVFKRLYSKRKQFRNIEYKNSGDYFTWIL